MSKIVLFLPEFKIGNIKQALLACYYPISAKYAYTTSVDVKITTEIDKVRQNNPTQTLSTAFDCIPSDIKSDIVWQSIIEMSEETRNKLLDYFDLYVLGDGEVEGDEMIDFWPWLYINTLESLKCRLPVLYKGA
jgi:hypothetical protein